MLTRLNLLQNHVTGFPLEENMLEKYKKMSDIDKELLDKIYFMGDKTDFQMIEDIITKEPVFV